jgi:hypothetical protein
VATAASGGTQDRPGRTLDEAGAAFRPFPDHESERGGGQRSDRQARGHCGSSLEVPAGEEDDRVGADNLGEASRAVIPAPCVDDEGCPDGTARGGHARIVGARSPTLVADEGRHPVDDGKMV